MANSQPQTTAGKWEIALLVGVLMLVAVSSVVTYWARSDDAEASDPSTAPTAASTPAAKPRTVAPAPITGEVVHADIYFDFKSTRLRADAVRLLQDKAALMDSAGAWAVLVHGYADRQGPAEYNRLLAERRATVVKQFLVELGVPEPSIKVVTIGQQGALCDDPSTECQQLNRRVHLEIHKVTRAAAEPVRPALLVGDTLDTRAGRRQEP